MVSGIAVLIITGFLAFAIIEIVRKRFPFASPVLLRNMFFFHVLLAFVYYLYAKFNPSDSIAYYGRITNNLRGDSWISYYGTSTTFIEFIGYPFIKFFGFSYEACMAFYAFIGYLGFLFFYIFFKENIRFKHSFFGFDLLTLIFFLPNLHFWSSSIGKGSVIFLGVALLFFGITKITTRWLSILIGALIVYHVRPHIMLVMLVSAAIGFMFTTKGISLPLRLAFLVVVVISFYFIYQDVLTLVGIDEEEFFSQGLSLTHRATELTKTTSGVDITSYSLPLQIFTFLYRPLFFDAPGILGLIVSLENLFYVVFTLRILNLKGLRYLITSNFLVKTALFSFLTVTIALAQISGNLGLAIRQKSQVMILFMFVIISFLDNEKLIAYKKAIQLQARRIRLANMRKEKAV